MSLASMTLEFVMEVKEKLRELRPGTVTYTIEKIESLLDHHLHQIATYPTVECGDHKLAVLLAELANHLKDTGWDTHSTAQLQGDLHEALDVIKKKDLEYQSLNHEYQELRRRFKNLQEMTPKKEEVDDGSSGTEQEPG